MGRQDLDHERRADEDDDRLTGERAAGAPIARPIIRGPMTSHVFRRSLDPALPVAARAQGSTIWDADGKAYLDAAGGAVVVGVGHGRESVARVMADQASRVAYAHGTAFTSDALERYADALAPHLPMADPAIYPVAGGSEAMESALKLVRSYHLARGETERWIVFARWGSYHGNTLGALDLSGRKPLRRPYEAWLGRFRHVSAAYPYRAGEPGANALGDADELAAELERAFEAAGPGPSRRSSRSRSSAPRSPPPCHPRATGRRSPRSAAATACSSSSTRS